MSFLELGIQFGSKTRKTSSAHGFHDNYGDIALGKDVVFLFGGAELPVQIVHLYLSEIPTVGICKASEGLRRGMVRESQITDLTLFLHLLEVLDAAAVEIIVNVALKKTMQEIEVDMVGLQPLKLLLEYGHVIRICPVVELGGKIEAVSGKALHSLTHATLGISVLIDICGIEVVHTTLEGCLHHLMRFRIVDRRIPLVLSQ